LSVRDRRSRSEDPEVLRYRRLFRGTLGLLACGGAATIAYGVAVDGSVEVAAFGVLIALATLTAGLLLGFIFGVPRSVENGDKAKRGNYSANTNLEQISDWLTKIIVGVGLVQFSTIISHYARLNDQLATGLGGRPAGSAVAGALIAFFGTLGFLLGHVVTRTSLTSTLEYFGRLNTGVVVNSLQEVRSSLAKLNSELVAKHREADDTEADPAAMTTQHNREPLVPVPHVEVTRVIDIVDLETHIEGLLGELVFPLSPRGRSSRDLMDVLLRRGVLDQAAADSLLELLDSAQQVAGGAEMSAEDAAAVRNSGLTVLRQVAALRRTAFAAFESHVLDLLRRKASTIPDVRVKLHADLRRVESERYSALNESVIESPKVDAIVERGGNRVVVEVRAQVHSSSHRHLVPLLNWLYSLPTGSSVLLVLPGDSSDAAEMAQLIQLSYDARVEILMWDSEADDLWPRVFRMLRNPGESPMVASVTRHR
jgi:hypothetical protein